MPIVGVNTVYELIMRSNSEGQQIRNVFYYEFSAGTPDENSWSNLANQFVIEVIPPIRDLLPTTVTIAALTTRRLNSLIDFGTTTVASAGLRAGSQSPIYVAAGLRLLRGTKETGNGSKRFGPLVKGDYTEDTLSGAAQTLLAAIGTAMEGTLTNSGDSFAPVIVGGKKDSAGNSVPEASWVYSPLGSTSIKTTVTTQNSRKIGRGI